MLKRVSAAIAIGLLAAAATAEAGTQLFEGSWSVKAFGNECAASKVGTTGGTAMLTRYPNCRLASMGGAARSGESEFYSVFRLPQGVQCNPNQPRCTFSETPTDGAGHFAPLGGNQDYALFCGAVTGPRPAKGETPTTGGQKHRPIAPLYRNPAFFTAAGAPNITECTATSTDGFGGKGPVQLGHPVTGSAAATTTGTGMGGFQFPAAPGTGAAGIRGTRVGEFDALYPYVYSYTYATLRNASGFFGPGQGPGSFSLRYRVKSKTVARVAVKQGAAKFGGTMKMLGALTTKACYYRASGCSGLHNDWRYEAIGATAYTSGGVVTHGYRVTWRSCLHPGPFGVCGTIEANSPPTRFAGSGARFPWTTGSVTVTAVSRGPHKTVHYAKGYDNRTPTSGKGTIQLVSPTLTRWLSPNVKFETGGIGILKLKFAPEPRAWLMLVAGVGCLGVFYRWRTK